MKHQIGTILPLIFVVIVSLVLCSCSSSTSMSTSTPTPSIEEEKAIELSISACKKPHLVLIGDPINIRSALVSLEEADKQTRLEGEDTDYGISMDTKVWVVQMDGQYQLVGGPEPVITLDQQMGTPTPPQPFFGTCVVVLNAGSGELIVVRNKQ